MKLVAGAAILLAIGAGLGTYFALRGNDQPKAPSTHSAILDAALERGLIRQYRAVAFDSDGSGGGSWEFSADGGVIDLSHLRRTRVGNFETLIITAEARRAPAGRTISEIAQRRFPHAKVRFFETNTVDSHTPDARIMLIPKAGA